MDGFDFSSLSFDFDLFGGEDDEDKEIRELIHTAKLNFRPVVFDNALEMAKEMDLTQDYFALVSGAFIFGDLLEAMCWKKALQALSAAMISASATGDRAQRKSCRRFAGNETFAGR